MLTEKPKSNIQRVYVTARDVLTGKSKTVTVYETTPERVVEALKRVAEDACASAAVSAGESGRGSAEASTAA